jgi:serine/threonine-protein kinase
MDPSSDAHLGAAAPRAETTSRYEVLARIASGGMADVFVGRVRGAVGFSRLVAIKRPHAFVSDDPALRNSFVLEAQVASAIHHPHVVSVLDVELLGEDVALILDYVEGCALSELLGRARKAGEPLPIRVALRVILDAASGLHAAHVLCDPGGRPLGLVHRDVSPQNILVGLDGHARLTDFGIAKVTGDMEHTAPNIFKGKLGYMAPEYLESKAFDARGDEYALAVVAWEALAGARLFRGGSDAETMRRILSETAPAPSRARPELAPLDEIFAHALARDPRDRFDSVSAFANALEHRARQLQWVAPHDEVARLVDAAVGDRLRERRLTIESKVPSQSLPVAGRQRASARDEVPTSPLHGLSPESPPSHVATVSPATPPRPPALRSELRRFLFAAFATSLLGAAIAVFVARGDHAGTASSPAASSATPSQIASSTSSPLPDPSEALPPPPVDSVSTVRAEPLPTSSPSAPAGPRSTPARRQSNPARSPPAPARSSGVLFQNPG